VENHVQEQEMCLEKSSQGCKIRNTQFFCSIAVSSALKHVKFQSEARSFQFLIAAVCRTDYNGLDSNWCKQFTTLWSWHCPDRTQNTYLHGFIH